MVAAVKALPQEILDLVEYREWSIRTLNGAVRLREMGARSLPAVAIAGKLKFESIIPGSDELISAIVRAAPKEV